MFRLLPAVFALLLADVAFARTPQPIFTRSTGPSFALTEELVISPDGSFVHGAQTGKLPKAALTELTRAIAKTRFVMEPPPRVLCTGIPNRRTQIKTRRGTVSWSSPCARGPHTSVTALDQLAARLVAEHTPVADPDSSRVLVTHRIQKNKSIGGETTTIHYDGSWLATIDMKTTRGRLTAAQLQGLRDLMKTLRVAGATQRVECAARLDGFGSITVDGLGSHRWSIPCADLDPSLGEFIHRVLTLTR